MIVEESYIFPQQNEFTIKNFYIEEKKTNEEIYEGWMRSYFYPKKVILTTVSSTDDFKRCL